MFPGGIMRKVLGVVLFLILIGFSYGKSVRVLSPAPKEVLVAGKSYEIKWVNPLRFPVDIKLFSNKNVFISNIRRNVKPLGKRVRRKIQKIWWSIPVNHKTGKFRIKFFKSRSKMVVGTSGYFAIRPKPKTPDLEIVDIGFDRNSNPPYRLWLKVRNLAGNSYLEVKRLYIKIYRNGQDTHMDTWPTLVFRGRNILTKKLLVFLSPTANEKSLDLTIEINVDKATKETNYSNNKKTKKLYY